MTHNFDAIFALDRKNKKLLKPVFVLESIRKDKYTRSVYQKILDLLAFTLLADHVY